MDNVWGGLSTTLPDYKIGKEFSPYMRNVFVDNGKLEQSPGFITLGSTNVLSDGEGIFPYYQEDGTKNFLVTDSSMILSTQDYKFYVFVSSNHTPTVVMHCNQIRNNMWCSNGSDNVFSWNNVVKTKLDGSGTTPNVPKGKFQAYYQERVFECGLPNNASECRYSDFRSTNGVQISPENFLAWPVGNDFFVGQGDGQNLTAVWVENGQLQFGKDNSIYTLYGNGPSNYAPRLSNPDIGVASQDSLKIQDGEAHFLGNNGIYRGRKRISDPIQNDVLAINKNTSRVVENLWETTIDFNRGQYFGTTTTVNGILQTDRDQNVFIPAGNPPYFSHPIPGNSTLSSGATFYGPIRLTFANKISSSSIFYVNRIDFGGSISNPNGEYKTILYNLYTGENQSTTTITGFNTFFSSQSPLIEGWQVNQASFAIKFEWIAGASIGPIGDTSLRVNWYLNPATTGQFMSEVSTLAMVTAWGNFDSLRTPNGGTINYFIRTSTSSVNITTQVWQNINPGVTVSAPIINKYVQWATTITSVSSYTNISNIDNVTIDHIEGAGASNRAFAETWKNRWWLFTSTENTNLSLLYVKSRITNPNPDAWMPVEGINVRSVARDNTDALYAGSSSTGTFYRLDYGTNYNGVAIISIYNTPSLYIGDLFTEKKLFEYYMTADMQSGKNLILGLSVNGGSFSNKTVSLDGTGRYNKSIQNVIGTGKLFKWQFTQNQLDMGMDITNFAVRYMPTEVRKGIGE